MGYDTFYRYFDCLVGITLLVRKTQLHTAVVGARLCKDIQCFNSTSILSFAYTTALLRYLYMRTNFRRYDL